MGDTFLAAGTLFGVEVAQVQEIIRHREVTAIPRAPKAVAGLINLRGQIVPTIDLRACLRMPERRGDALPTNLVLRTEDGAVSLLVDEIKDVLDVEEGAFEPPPDNLRWEMRELIRGVYKLDGGLLMALATDRTIAVATASPSLREESSASSRLDP
jgi:purine-binding chemotaxis protein CheW